MGDPMRKLKKTLVVIVVLVGIFAIYVEIVNRNSRNMTYRQKVLKAIYPAVMWFTRLTGSKNSNIKNDKTPVMAFHTLHFILNNGKEFSFEELKGKKVLLVNTASNCGYTNQYEELEQLSELKKEGLVVIGFPANDFKEQERGSDEQIAEFCKVNYGVTFPLARKSSVIRGADQNPVYQWLTDPAKNGWNSKQPEWNFSKYLIDEKGVLRNYFGPSISPMSNELLNALK
jgi:glutathione peroxidase